MRRSQRLLVRWLLLTVALMCVATVYAVMEGAAHEYLAAHWLMLPLIWPITEMSGTAVPSILITVVLFINAAAISGVILLLGRLLRRRPTD